MVSVVQDKCLLNIGHFILNIIHILYSVYGFISAVIIDFSIRTRTLCMWIGLLSKPNNCVAGSTDYVSLRKIPKHLLIIIGCESILYRDLVRVILWCNQLGIKYISFYHQNNDIDLLKLYDALCQQSKENLTRIKWGKSFGHIKEQAKRDINGYKWSPQLQVDVFRIEDGHQFLANASKELCRKNVGAALITQPYLEELFGQQMDAPDPDLALICGAACSTYGFPPWQLRITEFLHLKTHHEMKFKEFVMLLQRYSNCEQRFGK